MYAVATVDIDKLKLHPSAEAVPEPDAADRANLKADLEENGQLDPVDITTTSLILDGRTRWQILQELGARTILARVVPVPEADQPAYVIHRAVNRRHLTQEQKHDLIRYLANLVIEVGPAGELVGLTAAEIAKAVGVSVPTVSRVGLSNDTPTPKPTHVRKGVEGGGTALQPLPATALRELDERVHAAMRAAIHFGEDGRLGNGQNRMVAVQWAGKGAWFRVEFGWPEASFDAMDLGSARNSADVLRHHAVADPRDSATLVSLVVRYDETAGSTRSWMNSSQANWVPSALASKKVYGDDEVAFLDATRRGKRLYKALDKSLRSPTWAAAFYICNRVRHDEALAFFGAVENGGSDPAVQATREHFVRRSIGSYRTGDRREPLENILRAFQAYLKGDKPGFVRQGGFKLTLIR